MILTKPIILSEIKEKRIKITPFDKKLVSAGAITLRLGEKLRVFPKPKITKQGIPKLKKITLTNNLSEKDHTKVISIKKGYELNPGELVLGLTKEKVSLPDNVCGWLQTRSRFARFGLMTYVSSNFLQPGVKNHQVLEIYNAGPNILVLKPNQQLCKLVLEKAEGHATYKGKYKNQQKL